MQTQKKLLEQSFAAERIKLQKSRSFWRKAALAEAAVIGAAVYIYVRR
jgi:hypothetical protein